MAEMRCPACRTVGRWDEVHNPAGLEGWICRECGEYQVATDEEKRRWREHYEASERQEEA